MDFAGLVPDATCTPTSSTYTSVWATLASACSWRGEENGRTEQSGHAGTVRQRLSEDLHRRLANPLDGQPVAALDPLLNKVLPELEALYEDVAESAPAANCSSRLPELLPDELRDRFLWRAAQHRGHEFGRLVGGRQNHSSSTRISASPLAFSTQSYPNLA